MRRWRFYETAAGRAVVREELAALSAEARARIAATMTQHRRGELMPYEEEHLGGDLHALRVFCDHASFRVLYAHEGAHEQVLLALHVVAKRDRKLPVAPRRRAEDMLRDWRSRSRGG